MTMTTKKSRNHTTHAMRMLGVPLLALGLAACEVEETDGIDVTTVPLPLDSLLTLYCDDVGVGAETCVLDDPENPFAKVPLSDDNKFDLATPSSKAEFYLWATAQAQSARGENQYYTAEALHKVFAENGDDRIKEQALRAYRAVLDNHLDEVTFFGPFPPGSENFTPQKVALRVAYNLLAPTQSTYTGDFVPLFADINEVQALFGQWGYTYVPPIESGAAPDFVLGEPSEGFLSRNF